MILLLSAIILTSKFLQVSFAVGINFFSESRQILSQCLSHITISIFLFGLVPINSALQIFNLENHPAAFKAGSSKEGLSIFGILNKTKVIFNFRLYIVAKSFYCVR